MGTYRKWTKEKLDGINQMIAEGIPQKQIAREFGTSLTNLRYIIHYYKLSGSKSKSRLKDKREEDLATRIRILKGEEVRSGNPSHFFTDNEIQSWLWEKHGVKGCKRFCKDVLNVSLQPYQMKMVENMQKKPRALFCMGRQSGKDFTISVFVIWRCICNSNEKLLIVSPAQRQSTLLFERVMSFIAGSLELFDSVQKSSMEVLEFTNNSKIYNLPATSYIRGFTEVTGIFFNETAHGLEEEVFASCEPMLATTNGFLHQFSSPSGCVGKFWDCYNSPLYWKMKPIYPSRFGLPSSVNKYVSKQWLVLQKQTLTSVQYDMEINANFSEAVNNFFSASVLDRITQEYDFVNFPQEGLTYYLGVDWGRMKDMSVLTVVSEDGMKQLKVVLIKAFRKPFSEQVHEIIKLYQKFRFRKATVEYSGLSMGPCEQLKEAGLPIEFFVPTITEKEQAFNNLLKVMESDLLTIPKHSLLQYELRTFQYEINPQGRMRLHHVTGGSDDYVDSLCFSVLSSRKESGRIFVLKDPDNVTGLFG